MKHSIQIKSLDGLDAAAREFLERIGDHKILALYGRMGAGKTTFTTAVCKALGVNGDAVSSPTFAIVNEYRTANGEPMFHFDFYRIESIREALDIGFYDYIDSGCLCIMEWPENIAEILPEETLKVSVEVGDGDVRTVSWED